MRLSTVLFAAIGVALIFAAAPFLSAGLALLIADLAGCVSGEGGPKPCLYSGVELGPTVYSMGIAFWLFILSWLYIPLALILSVVPIIVRQLGKRNPSRDQPVGVIFWLVFLSAMLAAFAETVALVLIVAAGSIWAVRRWKRQAVAEY
jgi:hypothetical protein